MTEPVLLVENLSFQYRTADTPALVDLSFTAHAGEVFLVAGSSGCGKSTLLRCVNGLIPRSYKGLLQGRVTLAGQPTAGLSLAQIAQLAGTLLQDPEKQTVASHVAEEVAFGPENLGWPRERIRAAVEQALEELGIGHLRDRETYRLSGGEKQKVALAGLLAMNPQLLLLDEPLASLDPVAAHAAITAIREQADRGRSVLLVEHRIEDALGARPEQTLFLRDGRQEYLGDVAGLLQRADPTEVKLPGPAAVARLRAREAEPVAPVSRNGATPRPARQPLVSFEQVEFWYGDDGEPVLKGISLDIRKGDVIAILGPNGSGKSTLVKHAIGLNKPRQGRVLVEGRDTRAATTAQLARTVGYVFQSPTHMLFAPTVREELAFGPRNMGFDAATIAANTGRALDALGLAGLPERAPLSLSFGQQKRVGIAAVLAMQSRILLMDEPTAGQDYRSYTRFMDEVTALGALDAVLFVTHDLDLALTYANRVLLLRDGRIAADGPPEVVLRDPALLRSCNILPTSLLELNLRLLPQLGHFMGIRPLATYLRAVPDQQAAAVLAAAGETEGGTDHGA